VASLAILALGIALDRVTQGRRVSREQLPARRPARGLGLRRAQVQPR
jgi:ABC-type proline/glycine betaine transport system permease subunit